MCLAAALARARYTSRVRAAVLLLLVASCSSGEPMPAPKPPAAVAPHDGTVPVAAAVPDDAPGLRLPDGVEPLGYDVRLELDPERETFVGHVAIRVRLAAPARRIWLHADELDLERVRYRVGRLSGNATVSAATEHELHAIGFPEPVPAGEVVLELDYAGHVGEDVEGLFRQQAGGRWFLYSQAEATFARRIVPCFDEPRFKVPWRVTLVVPAGQVALANAPQTAERPLADGRREVTFAEMPALPAHLFAVAVGPFALVEVGKVGRAGVPVRLAVAPAQARRVAAARAWTPKLVDELERYFDQPLPLAKLDLVAVPRFFGAMENPGLITFEVTTLAGDDADPAFVRRHTRFLAHELAHQWVGNAVTPAWWNDLWLAEAFATWLDDKLSNALGTLDDPALRTQRARAHALAADRAVTARPLRRTPATNDEIEDAFDAIAYEKGAAVIAMFEQFLGEARFRDVMRAYVRRAPVATADDFVAELGRADAALARAFAGYLDHAGVPIVDLALACGGGKARAIATPRDGAAVPVCLRHPAGTACALATGPTAIALPTCPAWLVGNAGGRGYYHVQWAPPAAATPTSRKQAGKTAPAAGRDAGAAIGVLAPAERLAYGEDRAAAFARGEVARADAVSELDALLALRDPYAELAALAIATEVDRTVGEAAASSWGAELARRFARRLTIAAVWRPRTALEVAARETLVELVPPDRFSREAAQLARGLVERALRDGPTALRSVDLVVAVALAAPAGGRALFERIVAAAASEPAIADEWFEALAYFDARFAPRAVALVLDRRFEPHRAWAVIGGMLARTPTRSAAWRAVRARLGELLATLGAHEAGRIVEATASLCTAQERTEVAAAFTPHATTIDDGRRTLDRALAAIDRCVTASGGPTGSAAP